mmetsp:Transcript_36485/g.113757  ORF Transcript_36485/g.113757 Transcript_36485/m.113757 type:complete len:146 (+) Transcript_36485:1403-1840(+)
MHLTFTLKGRFDPLGQGVPNLFVSLFCQFVTWQRSSGARREELFVVEHHRSAGFQDFHDVCHSFSSIVSEMYSSTISFYSLKDLSCILSYNIQSTLVSSYSRYAPSRMILGLLKTTSTRGVRVQEEPGPFVCECRTFRARFTAAC